jgi:integrase
MIFGRIKPVDLENLQAKRKQQGYSDASVDQEISAAKTMINKAFDNDLFLYKGKLINNIRTGLVKACEATGIGYLRFVKGGFVFHDLRRTFNTFMRKANVPESVIMATTGHATREMFDRYNSIDREDLRDAIKRYQDFVKAPVLDGGQRKND